MAAKKKAAPPVPKLRHGAPKGTFGQPKFVPTPAHHAQVLASAGVGSPHGLIASNLGISEDTLTRHFADELAKGRARAIEQMAKTCYARALGTGVGAHVLMMFWLKTQAGWKETDRREIVGADGKPIELINATPEPDLSSLNEEDLLMLEHLSAKVMNASRLP